MKTSACKAALLATLASSRVASADPVVPARDLRIEQHIGAAVPTSGLFRDEAGAAARLSDYLQSGPAILVFAYFECPMLCPLTLSGLAAGLEETSLRTDGYEVIVLSIAPTETPPLAASTKRRLAKRHPLVGRWHFLTGDEASVRAVTDRAGFAYRRDPATGGYAHAAVTAVLTRDGRISRYLYGIEPAPRDLQLAVVEASAGRLGGVVDAMMLYCFHYDPETGRYGLAVMSVLRGLGIATVLGLALYIHRRTRVRAHG